MSNGGEFIGNRVGPMPDWAIRHDWDVDFDEIYDGFIDEEDNETFKKEKSTMTKDYMTSRGYAYATEAEAIADAKKYAAKNFEDVKIFKAYKIVSTTTPNVDVADYTLPVV